MIDPGHVVETLLKAYWWAIPIPLLAAFAGTPFFKGMFGEWTVDLAARLQLDRGVYHLLRNVTLPTEDGTTQIDHIIVSRYGVFVVETKNMKGWIFGGDNRKTWTQQIYKSKHPFQNPLHQNYKHTKTIEAALGLDPHMVFSVVVFVGDNTFKTPMPANVTQGAGYIRYIKSKRKVVITQADVEQIVRQIGSDRLKTSIRTHMAHARHVRGIVEAKAAPDMEEIKACPRCGSAMVLRVAGKGDQAGKPFWGCSAYPRCRASVEATN